MRDKLYRGISFLLTLIMIIGLFPQLQPSVNAANGEKVISPLYREITVTAGQLVGDTGEIVDNEIYGYVVDYELKKGHILSISDTDYVFSVRKFADGNYSTMLKQATTAEFKATEDMTVGMLIRKPDKSALTEEELAAVKICDSQYGMIGADGYAHRFTVEAETIDGGTQTTRAAIFLPESYSDSGEPAKLIIMTHGYNGYLAECSWYGNSADNTKLVKAYLDADYAVLVVDNTTESKADDAAPDLGCPQLVSSFIEAYQYVQENLNVEEKFSLHSRSFGTFAAMRIMQEVPELIKCALMTGPRVSLKLAYKSVDKSHMADRFGFDDTTGAAYEADKLVGYDPYTDVDGEQYALPPTFWMLCEGDATAEPLEVVEKLLAHGNDVTCKTYNDTNHNGICRLSTEQSMTDALEFLETHDDETDGLTHAVPESEGVANVIKRAHLLTDITWTPLKNMPGVISKNGVYSYQEFEAGKTYTGIPYSGVIDTDTYVGLNVSLNSFVTALQNENSVLYTENLFAESYPKKATYFGTVCSKFAQYALNVPGAFNTANVPNIPGMETVAMPGKYDLNDMELGDVVVDTAYHTALCTDILYNAEGEVVQVEISEAVLPVARRMLWSADEFAERFADYRLCRYAYIDDVPAADTVSAEADPSLMPRFGDKYNYRVSNTPGVVDILKSGYSKAVILRDGVVAKEIQLDASAKTFSFDRSIPGDIEMYLEKADGIRSESVYACVVSSSVAVTDNTGFWSGELSVTCTGTDGVPLYVQLGSGQSVFCALNGKNEAVVTFNPSAVSVGKVRVAYENEYGIYLSPWAAFTIDESGGTGANPSCDPMLSQGVYWDGYTLTPSSSKPVIQENKKGHWTYAMVPVEGNTTYYSEGANRSWYFDSNKQPISTINVYKECTPTYQFSTPENAAYMSLTYSPKLVEQGTESMSKVSTEKTLSLRYDDHYDVSGKTVEIIDAGAPTSYQVGYGVEENTVLDTAVVTLEGDNLIATGIGTAKVKIDGEVYTVTVKAAPISLFMITGHSMGAGQAGSKTESVVGPDGQVYSSHGTANLSASTQGIGISYAALNRAKNVNAFTESGEGTIGEGSALAWEWNRLTDEKVWVLNTAVGGSCLKEWIPGTTNYKNAVKQYRYAQEILSNEIRAGHYTLSHMGILYHNGANFSYKGVNYTQADLQNWYEAMWSGFKAELMRDMDGNGTKETAEFLGMIPIWIKSAGISYTKDEPAGLYMAACDEYEDIFTASVIGQEWLTNSDVAANFPEINYTTQDGTAIRQPQTTGDVFAPDGVHYQQVGYNAVGIDIAREIVTYLNGTAAVPTVKILLGDGRTEAGDTIELNYQEPVLLVPVVEPITVNDLSFEIAGCVEAEYPLQVKAISNGTGSLSIYRGKTVLKTITFTCNDAPKQLALSYDDHYDVSGKTVEIIDAGSPTSYQVGYGVEENAVLDTAVVTLEGDKLIATGIGTAKVKIDGETYAVTVDKAKLHLVVIMGQSNAGNHFDNATSDVVCKPGTAYWWGNGLGTNATEPAPYTQPSKGFHTPLIAELYAQSTAAGDPVKPVMIWHEGITSKNGQSITKWAASATDTGGTNDTVTMIENCLSYYEQHSDKYEIVGKGVYWLQGESDIRMNPEAYTQRFMAMWNRLKAAGMEYLAFLRVRWDTKGNSEDHQDLHYSASLSAQLQMINENPEFYMATDLTENWVGTADTVHTVDISNYITMMDAYGGSASYTDTYGNNATYANGKLTTTMKTLYGSNNKCHYGKFGYGLIGADAAYNMCRALHADSFAIVQTDTSGHADAKKTAIPGSVCKIDITELDENLAFRADCGSTAGTLAITVKSGAEDITDRVISDGLNTYGTVDTALLRTYEEPIITVTFTPVSGKSGSVVYQIEDNSPEAPKMYFWDFEQDMNARDENGEIVNGFGDAVYGSYVLKDGKLKATDLHIALENTIRLSKAKNWSIEWKFGEVRENSKGFLFSSKNENVIGNKAFYHVKTGQFMISDYADSKGYRNYTLDTVLVSSGDVMKITNRFDPESGRSIMSLWQNGELVIEDFQLKGSFNAATSDLDMTPYPLSGEFLLNYMGSGNFATVTDEFEYIRVIPDTLTYDAEKTIALSYDDHYDLSGKTVEIIDAGSPTSYQVGYGVEENAVLDTAVVTLDGDTLIATGIGSAKVKIDGETYTVTVKAAPISLLLLAGQSNMRGSEGNANQSIICPDGMVYSTYGDDRGADNTAMTKENAHLFAASALAGDYSTVNVAGNTDCLSGYPLNTLTEAGAGKIGPDSGFAYEWVKQTGEKVWVVNAAHGGTSISVWQKGTTEYEQCKALFTACQETLRKEIAAGHYTLSHMAYFWCQGCSDRTKTAEWYVDKYLAMHDAFKSELTFDHDSDPATAEKTFEFGGIIPVRVGSTAACYRDGVNSDTNTYSYHEAFVDLRMSGSRAAQFWMGNNPELEDIWNVCTIGDDWVWMPDGTNGVSEYFNAHYPGGTVDYTPQVAQKASWYTPTTPKAVHDTIHYNQIGYNEIGRESVRNALIMMGINEDYDEETTVEFVNWTGYQPAEEITAYTSGQSGTLVVPIVSPITRCKDVTYTVTEGLTYKYFDLLAESGDTTGTLTAVGANAASVNVVKQAPGALYADHLAELPEKLCKGVNLWSVLEHDPLFYSSGTNWGTHSSGTVYSLTIPVQPGDKLYATSFGKAGENGHATANGIRVTFFGDYSVVKTMDPGGTYAEFKANGGYLVAPEGATAINIPLWTNEDSNEVYILGLEHDKTSEICSICGKSTHEHSWSDWETVSVPSAETQGVERRRCSCGETDERKVDGVWQKYALADHLAELPENVCHDTNLWAELEHDEEYFASGVRWGVYSGGSVCSVTIPVIAGEKVYASSFGKSGENGHATSNGIRTTFFDAYGVAKTMTPAENYAEFKANGGYLIVPEGAIAISIAMWTDSDEWEIYLLDRGHTPGEAVKENEAADGAHDSVVYCTACGTELSREHVEGKTHTPGDINGDGSVNNKDFTRLFQYLADWDVEVVEAALDVNGDGTVNNKDLTRLFQYLSDWDVVIH